MPKDGEYGATSFVEQYNAGELNIPKGMKKIQEIMRNTKYVWECWFVHVVL